MPNRIIKESICTSEELANISDGAETLFYRLIVKADDFGCYYADPEIVRNICFAKKKRVKEAHVIKWLEELKNNNLIIIYEDNGKPYLQLKTFENHQQRRATKPKFPLPTSDINCYQPQSNAPINENVNENVNENENENDNNSVPDGTEPGDLPEKKIDPYQALFDYYLTLDLVKHKELTPEMRNAIDIARRRGKYDWDTLKTFLERHAYVVKLTKGCGQYEVPKRGITEFFGQKVYGGTALICSEYADDGAKWLRYKDGLPKSRASPYEKESWERENTGNYDYLAIDPFADTG